MNNGYVGYSMSNRALDAYENGEMPLSKWNKSAILDEIERIIKEEELKPSFTIEDLKKISKQTLADAFLSYSSWHHTSSRFNKTDFYNVNSNRIKNVTINDLNYKELSNRQAKDEKNEAKKEFEYAIVEYEVFEGSKRFGKFVKYEKQGIILNGWFHLLEYYDEKKKLDGNHILKIERLGTRKPIKFDTKKVKNLKERLGL